MHFSFKLTLTTTAQNLYTLISGAVTLPASQNYPAVTDMILPKSVCELELQADSSNGAGTVTVGDNLGDSGRVLYAGDIYLKRESRNVIDLTRYTLKGSAASLHVEGEIESI